MFAAEYCGIDAGQIVLEPRLTLVYQQVARYPPGTGESPTICRIA